MQSLAEESQKRMKESFDDDLNTAQAQAAIFDMARAANAAMDSAELKHNDAVSLLAVLSKFDEIFAVLHDDDAAKMQSVLAWAKAEGRDKDISPELLEIVNSAALSDEQINQKIEEMQTARRVKDFARSDAVRAELAAAGILIEQTKDGVRWRRK
jgi:cysteinyl-tRNA synthetase